MATPTVRDNSERMRYEVLLDDEIVGFIDYRRTGEVVVMTHAEVRPEHEGRGVGSALAQGALDDVRARGLQVEARCSFVAAYIKRHPGYADLVSS
jgi:predicted GNAT family acetyltransferase